MKTVLEKIKKITSHTITKVLIINILVFIITNCLFDIKYEQVDDFIIYNLYSGLDGTYNVHGVYIHPVICFLLGIFYRIIPVINWHTIFLLSMQLLCFTTIGTNLLKRNGSKLSYVLYILFISILYPSLLELIQYTSVSALLILTAFFVIMDKVEQQKQRKAITVFSAILFTIGIMTRMQSLLIIIPFFALYMVYEIIQVIRKKSEKTKLFMLLKQYGILAIITVIIYISNLLIYQTNDVYKNFMEFNDMRAYLHDISYTNYATNQEIFDEIGWSENDHYLFYTFNFGDENVYNKENLQKIIDYKKSNGTYYSFDFDLEETIHQLEEEMKNTNPYITILFFGAFVIALYTNRKKTGWVISIFLVTILVHMLFIVLNRSMLRVVIPEYILGTAMMLYFVQNVKETKEKIDDRLKAISVISMVIIIAFSGGVYKYNYELEDYSNYKNVINYTNAHKENVYLYTVPSLQYRYLVYPVYTMPPKGAFSNLRVMGGWDMYTENYYDFKERYDLEGTFLDLLKENVYLIDGDVTWSGNYYHNYIDHIVQFIKEHYQKEVTYTKVETFDNIYVYKLEEVIEQ